MSVSRRELIRAAIAAGVLHATRANALVSSPRPMTSSADKLVLGAPLTHSDWMLKPGIESGPAGVRHMLDTCKACGWTQIYWRAWTADGRCIPARSFAPGDKWDDDSFWSPKDPHDRAWPRKSSAMSLCKSDSRDPDENGPAGLFPIRRAGRGGALWTPDRARHSRLGEHQRGRSRLGTGQRLCKGASGVSLAPARRFSIPFPTQLRL